MENFMEFILNFVVAKTIYYYECNTNELKLYEEDGKLIKRRYFLIEKIKDSKTIGIVIGTIGVANYLEIIDRMKKLINRCGKKYYLISVGKPTVAKLANLGDVIHSIIGKMVLITEFLFID